MASPTYPSTHEGLRARVYRRLHTEEGAAHSWDNQKVQDALNWVQQEIQQELVLTFQDAFWVRARAGVTPNAQGRINLPPDVLRPLAIDKETGTGWREVRPGIVPLSRRYEYIHRTAGFPTFADQTNAVCEVWLRYPTYLQAEGVEIPSGTYRLHEQYRIPDLQADDQETEILPEFTDVLVDGAAWRLARDVQHERTEVLRRDYLEGLGRAKSQAALRTPAARHRTIDVYRRRRGW